MTSCPPLPLTLSPQLFFSSLLVQMGLSRLLVARQAALARRRTFHLSSGASVTSVRQVSEQPTSKSETFAL